MKTSYFPPFGILKFGLRFSDDRRVVSMSRELFCKLLAAAVRAEFDPVWYCSENPDIAAPVKEGAVADELEHFAAYGYEEGRRQAYFEVDEAWYLEEYRDVAEAVEAGDFIDAEAHFNATGYIEGRAGDAEMQADTVAWADVIAASRALVGAEEPAVEEPAAATDEGRQS
jgi:hypothetical protein